MPSLINRKQREMLTLTVQAGHVSNFSPARFHSAWTVRVEVEGGASIIRTFADSTGKKLLALGLIEPHPDPEMAEVHGPGGIIGRRYVATAVGLAEVQKRKGK